MKKLPILLTATLAAGLAGGAAAPAVAQDASTARGTPEQVTRSTTPSRDRTRPYRFTTKGRIIPPPRYCTPGSTPGPPGRNNCIPVRCPVGVTDPQYCTFPGRGAICSGRVNVRYQSRGSTISSRNVKVRPDCTYRSTVTFRTRLKLRRGAMTVRARFQGNPVLGSRSSRTGTVRAGTARR